MPPGVGTLGLRPFSGLKVSESALLLPMSEGRHWGDPRFVE